MVIVRVDDPKDPRLEDYAGVREPVLLRERGVFIAESREVVRILLEETDVEVRSLLLNDATLSALEGALGRLADQTPVYVGDRALTREVIGFDIHRGCLAAAERPESAPLETLLSASTLVVLESVSNPDNVGSVFRNALALGAGGVVLGPRCADPYYRKTIRTSMAAVLRLPHATLDDWPHGLVRLRDAGFTVVALTPRDDAVDIADLAPGERVALLLGNEGAGLSDEAIAAADVAARIPISSRIDSVNVATASGIGLYALSRR